jgi:hypothetical protein
MVPLPVLNARVNQLAASMHAAGYTQPTVRDRSRYGREQRQKRNGTSIAKLQVPVGTKVAFFTQGVFKSPWAFTGGNFCEKVSYLLKNLQ